MREKSFYTYASIIIIIIAVNVQFVYKMDDDAYV